MLDFMNNRDIELRRDAYPSAWLYTGGVNLPGSLI